MSQFRCTVTSQTGEKKHRLIVLLCVLRLSTVLMLSVVYSTTLSVRLIKNMRL
jgi:hypothetical protein